MSEREHNADSDADLKNANLWAINLLLYPRQLLVFPYLFMIHYNLDFYRSSTLSFIYN